MTGRGIWMIAGALLAAGFGLSAPSVTAQPEGEVLAISGATIFDATGKDPFRGTVIVRDGRIVDVGAGVRIPAGARVILAEGKALLPGFFDVHTHWSPSGSPAALPRIASAYVESGVTTVNDFHQQPEAFEPRRQWLARLVAPHVNFVARVSTPGGHGADWGDVNTTKWVATAESARREIEALQAYKPDFIKGFADGWRYGTLPEETSMNLETLSGLVSAAHEHGQRVLTHTVTVERGKIAARADVDVIAHSIQDRELDDEAVALIKSAGTFYAPTLAIYEPKDLLGATEAELADPVKRQRLRKWGFAQHNLRTLFAAGVPVVLGTDAGIGDAKHGESSLHELELMVAAGLSPKAVLLAGTSNSAMALGLIQDRGTIEKGKRADLILVAGKPWENIADIRKLDRVIIDGAPVLRAGVKLPAANHADALPASPASELIDDFERSDGRSALDTLRLTDMDSGVERSVVVTNLVPRTEGGRALELAARMSPKANPEAGVLIPLRRGSVQPVDARKFQGIRLELRGEGQYSLLVNTLAGQWAVTIQGKPAWTEFRIPFPSLVPARARESAPKTWRGDDLLQVGLSVQRAAGKSARAEIDNVGFY